MRVEQARRIFGLGVQHEIDESELKKFYHREALKCHPDKHPDDPSATQRFQQLSEAYGILIGEADASVSEDDDGAEAFPGGELSRAEMAKAASKAAKAAAAAAAARRKLEMAHAHRTRGACHSASLSVVCSRVCVPSHGGRRTRGARPSAPGRRPRL